MKNMKVNLEEYGVRTSPNRAYLASCLRHSAQIQQSWTSDTVKSLHAIASMKGDKR